MTTLLCKARALCGTTCGQGPCPLVAAWMRNGRASLRAHRTRAELAGLTDVELKDIGLSRCQIDAGANETFSR